MTVHGPQHRPSHLPDRGRQLGSQGHQRPRVRGIRPGTELQLFFLPPYSPQSNPDEWGWKNVKHDRIARKLSQSKAELKAIAHGALRRLQPLPEIVQRSFRNPQLASMATAVPPAPARSRNLRSA